MEKNPQILLLGNGINLLFGNQLWEELIRRELSENNIPYTWEQIKDIPATMQIVLATDDQVKTSLKSIGKHLDEQALSHEQIQFLHILANLPVDSILTTNYSLEIERAFGFCGSIGSYSRKLVRMVRPEGSANEFRLWQYFPLHRDDGTLVSVWHIHGDIAKASSMIMGHYYYAKHLKEIQNAVASLIRRKRGCEKANVTCEARSWLDWFMMSDIYILGLGLYTCETDLWWLLCCKKRNFPETNVFFYDTAFKEDERNYLLRAYHGKTISEIDRPKNEKDFHRYYAEALRDIQAKICND